MAGKEQFDEYLGGSQALPNDVHIMKLVSSRASEIAAMTYSIENPQQTKLIFQKLPVHMRRRVMSHNAKRLPRRLREAHLNQMSKSGLPPKTKRPSRRYRRRPQNLLSEYNRRKRSKIWLETHIWHAKRFHMIEKWGYRIASHANDKCFRANYRAVAKHCLIQDISYYSCFQIIGPEDFLKNTLKAHCNPLELTFAAKIYTGGNREGTLMFFKKDGYPRFPIGNVHFLWRPNQIDLKTIWIWVHPSFFDDFHADIVSSFEFKRCENTDPMSSHCTDSYTYTNDNRCKMNIFRNDLNRFRFYGPLALNTLTAALHLPKLDEKFFSKIDSTDTMDFEETKEKLDSADSSNDVKIKDQEDSIEMKDINETKSKIKEETMQVESDDLGEILVINKSWYTEYYSIQENVDSLRTQEQLWNVLKTLESPSQLPPNIVLGFTVLDPRFYLPDKRTKPQGSRSIGEIMPVPPSNVNISPIWEVEIRRKVTNSCAQTSTINKLRSECLVPGISNDKYFDEEIMAKVPILLIQRPGTGNTGLSSGIDIVLPAGWAMPFWLAFLLRCARSGALRESRSIAFEYGNTQSPDVNDPDTPAYAREALSTKQELEEKYLRYPPNRRVNFIKLGISSPFFCEWKLLMKDWSNTEDFFVLRNRNLLSLLQTSIDSNVHKGNKRDTSDTISLHSEVQNKFKYKNCLIRVKVSILKRGCPRRFAIICIPTAEDIQKLESDRNWMGPVEKLNADPNEAIRKNLRKNHLVLLKRLRRQRVRRKKALIEKLGGTIGGNTDGLRQQIKSINPSLQNREIIREQSKKMTKLYLPNCSCVRYSCDREVMGYVTFGDFSFAEAKGIGIGYVTLNSLINLINNRHNLVLIRNTQTRQYRFAKLDVVIV